MVEAVNSSWAKTNATDAILNKVTYGQDIIFPSTWPTDRLFWRTDLNQIFSNVGSLNTPIFEALDTSLFFGDGSDGDVTISSNTDLGSNNIKNYKNLTINAGVTLQGNSGMVIKVKNTLTFVNATSIIHVNGKATSTTSSGGKAGGGIFIFARTILGNGTIQSNGTDGTSTELDTTVATNSKVAGVDQNGTGGLAGLNGTHGGHGGGFGGNGGSNTVGLNGNKILFTIIPNSMLFGMEGAEGGTANQESGIATGGGGSGGFILIITSSAFPTITLEATGGDSPSATHRGTGGSGGIIYALSKTAVTNVIMVTSGGTGLTSGEEGISSKSINDFIIT